MFVYVNFRLVESNCIVTFNIGWITHIRIINYQISRVFDPTSQLASTWVMSSMWNRRPNKNKKFNISNLISQQIPNFSSGKVEKLQFHLAKTSIFLQFKFPTCPELSIIHLKGNILLKSKNNFGIFSQFCFALNFQPGYVTVINMMLF